MKRTLVFSAAMVAFMTLTGPTLVSASVAYLFVDSAPNESDAYDVWWTDTQADIAADTFTNMRNGLHPVGSNKVDPYDGIAYDSLPMGDDKGRMLAWMYWMPGVEASSLEGRFQLNVSLDWGGDVWNALTNSWDDPGNPDDGWLQPGFEDYLGEGQIGAYAVWWVPLDNHALPYDTGGTWDDEVNQGDIDALRQEILTKQTYFRGQIRLRENGSSPWVIKDDITLDVVAVPAPGALLLAGFGVVIVRRLRSQGAI